MKLIKHKRMLFIVDALTDEEAIATAIESNRLYNKVWEDNSGTECGNGSRPKDYTVEELSMEKLGELLKSATDHYSGVYEKALVFIERQSPQRPRIVLKSRFRQT